MLPHNSIERLPQFLQDIAEFQAISGIEDEELNSLGKLQRQILWNSYIEDADEEGIKRWEQALAIIPGLGDALESRRFRIISLISGDRPYTLHALRKKLDILCGVGAAEVQISPAEYRLNVRLKPSISDYYIEVHKMLENMVPCNIVFDLYFERRLSPSSLYIGGATARISKRYTVRSGVNTHQTLGQFTHAELSKYTYGELMNMRIGDDE